MKQECVPGENIVSVVLSDPISLKEQATLCKPDFMPKDFGDYMSIVAILISIITCALVCWNNRLIAYYAVTMKLREEKIAAKRIFGDELKSLQNTRPADPILPALQQGVQRMEEQVCQFRTPVIHTKFTEMCRTVKSATEASDLKQQVVSQLKDIIQMMKTEINKMC